jgi:transposase InsO family protein
VQPDRRDEVLDFVEHYARLTELAAGWLVAKIGLGRSKFFDWKRRYGKLNEHNRLVPRDHWLLEEEKEVIVSYYLAHPDDGYRRVTYMMMDADVVAASPSSVYRVLLNEGVLCSRWNKPSSKGKGFVQPLEPHEHWHVDIAYVNVCGTFYYLCSVLDGCSRYVVHHEIREQMKEADVQLVIQRALELFPEVKPRVISDNGPQFIARDFKELIRIHGMTHVRTSPHYPQSNGKLERWHKSLKTECIRPRSPLCLEDARRIVAEFVEHYNTRRLHSAIGYVTPLDRLHHRQNEIFAERDRRLEAARERRRQRRAQIA